MDEQAFLSAVGMRIRSLRKGAGLSIESLASAAGLHATYISAIELGKRNPSLGVLYRVALALKVEPPALIDRTQDMDAPRLREELRHRLDAAGLEDLRSLSRLLDALR